MIEKYVLNSGYLRQKTELNSSLKKVSICRVHRGQNEDMLLDDERVLHRGGYHLNFESVNKSMTHLFELPKVYW